MGGKSRRDFLNILIGSGLFAGFGLAGFFGISFVVPKTHRKKRDILVRNMEQLDKDGIFEFQDFQGKSVLLIRHGERVRAFSSVCPHLGCKVKWEPEKNRFLCPCHIGIFDPEGQVVSGPPSTPLSEYPVKVEKGKIFVTLVEV